MGSNADRLAVVIAVLMGGCQEPTTRIGSACNDGVCPQRADGQQGEACLFAHTTAEISINGQGFVDICLPSELAVDREGHVSCKVHIALPGGAEATASSCAAAGFAVPDEFVTPGWEGSTCVVPQLGWNERADSQRRGWYYREGNIECTGPRTSVHFTEGTVPDDVNVYLSCSQALVVDGEGAVSETDPAECTFPIPGAGADVGAACTPLVPERGFDDRLAVLSTRADECESRACLVYRLRGDPSSDCTPRAPVAETGDPGLVCVSGDEAEQRIYCSCRCDAPEGDPGELCDCPEMFTCVEVMPDGPPGVRGSYCVRNGTFTSGP